MIDEPFQLSNYTVKQANRPFNVKGKSSSSHATDLATLTVQADGIHLLDVSERGMNKRELTQATDSITEHPSIIFHGPFHGFCFSSDDVRGGAQGWQYYEEDCCALGRLNEEAEGAFVERDFECLPGCPFGWPVAAGRL